jgi:signal peptidase I
MDEKYKKLINQAIGNAEEEKKDGKGFYGNLFKFVFEVAKVVAISAIIVLPVRYFLIQPFFVSGASMQPQFYNGEYLIIDEITYRSSAPERGDAIVFRYPNDPSQFYIKRVIGLPGETVEIKDGKVAIFNKENPWGLILEESYLAPGEITRGDIYQKIDDDKYFVLGDNRQASSDSRVWGLVEKKYIIGKVWLRAWPPDKIKVFKEEIGY